eukprot:gene7719-12189_t
MLRKFSLFSSFATTSFLTVQYIREPYDSILDNMIKFFYGQYRDYVTLEKNSKIENENLYHLSHPKFFFKIPKDNFIIPGLKIEEYIDPEVKNGGQIIIKDDYQNVFNIHWTPALEQGADFLKSIEFQNTALKKVRNLDLFYSEKLDSNYVFNVYRNPNYYHHPSNYFLDQSRGISPSNALFVGRLYFMKDDFYFSISFNYSNMLINYAILKQSLEAKNEEMSPPNHSKEQFEKLMLNSTYDPKMIIKFLKRDLLQQKIKFIKPKEIEK